MKRQRGRGRKPNGGGQSNRNFESNGPDIKIRGSASHVYDKYQQLARDAASSGDRIMAESYLQHAEHYFRVLKVQQQQQQQYARDRGDDPREGGPGGGQNTGQNTGQGGSQGSAQGARGDDSDAEQTSGRSSGNPLEVVDPEAAEQASADAGEDSKPRRARRPRRARAAEGDDASGDEAAALDNAASQ